MHALPSPATPRRARKQYIAVEGFARVAVVLTAAVIFRSTCAEAWERVVTVQGLNVHLPSWWLARRSELRARPVAIAVVSLAARLAILTYFSLRPIWARMCDTVQDVVAAKETLLVRREIVGGQLRELTYGRCCWWLKRSASSARHRTSQARVKGISTLVLCVVLSLALLVNGIGGQLSTILEFCGVILPPGRRAEPVSAHGCQPAMSPPSPQVPLRLLRTAGRAAIVGFVTPRGGECNAPLLLCCGPAGDGGGPRRPRYRLRPCRGPRNCGRLRRRRWFPRPKCTRGWWR